VAFARECNVYIRLEKKNEIVALSDTGMSVDGWHLAGGYQVVSRWQLRACI
jgi:hypothetical protein